MLKIQGARNYLYQWDLNQKVIVVDNDSVNEVHFVNEGQNDNALTVEVKEDSKARYAEIPNILLQSGDNIIAYEHCEDNGEYTFRKYLLEVIRRPKPADYVYTETEIKSYEALQADLDKKIDAPQTAAVGEVLTVEEVDEDGKPTKWKTAPAAAEQKQADWAQNDDTAADYVKNKPFYGEVSSVVCLEPTTYTFTALSGWANLMPTNFNIGDILTVKWNGVEYKCEAKGINVKSATFGNKSLRTSGSTDTGEPFYFELNYVNSYVVVAELGTVMIEITAENKIYHTIPNEYMPDGYGKAMIVNFTDSDGTIGEPSNIAACDTSPTDILKAFLAGTPVYGKYGNDDGCIFTYVGDSTFYYNRVVNHVSLGDVLAHYIVTVGNEKATCQVVYIAISK